MKEVLFSRHLVSESRIRIEESKVFEQDLRTVNQQLSKELTSIQIAYDSLLAAKKIVDINLKDERIVLQVSFELTTLATFLRSLWPSTEKISRILQRLRRIRKAMRGTQIKAYTGESLHE